MDTKDNPSKGDLEALRRFRLISSHWSHIFTSSWRASLTVRPFFFALKEGGSSRVALCVKTHKLYVPTVCVSPGLFRQRDSDLLRQLRFLRISTMHQPALKHYKSSIRFLPRNFSNSSVDISDFLPKKWANSSDLWFDSSEVSFDSSEEFFLSSVDISDLLGSYWRNSSGGIQSFGRKA